MTSPSDLDTIREALTVPSYGSVAAGYFESREDFNKRALAALDAVAAELARTAQERDGWEAFAEQNVKVALDRAVAAESALQAASKALEDCRGALLAYWTDIPQAEVERLLAVTAAALQPGVCGTCDIRWPEAVPRCPACDADEIRVLRQALEQIVSPRSGHLQRDRLRDIARTALTTTERERP